MVKNNVVLFSGGGGAMQVLGDRAVQFNNSFVFQLLYHLLHVIICDIA